MAGDWIKLETSTCRKPEIMRLARILGVSCDDALGKCVRFWAWLDDVCSDSNVDACVDACVDAVVDIYAPQDVDDLLNAPGFFAALSSVGWARWDEKRGCAVIPKFFLHNGETSKKRAQKSRRQAKWRANAPSDVDADVDAGVDEVVDADAPTREEKRREEYIRKEKQTKETPAGTEDEPKPAADTPPPKPSRKRSKAKPEATAEFWQSSVQAASKNPVVISALTDWYAHKLDRQEPYLEGSVAKQLAMARNAVTAYGPQVFASAITRAIANNWSGWDHSLDVLAAQQQRDDAARQQRQQGRDCA